jgi:Kef-type K+ transport system membrane component KefB
MTHPELITFFFQIAAMLAVGLVFRHFMNRVRWPGVVGELIGGILLGPTIFGALSPDLYARLFPSVGLVPVGQDAVIKIGMVFFLFSVGLELEFAQVRRRAWTLGWTSISGIVVPFALGVGLVLLWPGLWGPPAVANFTMFALFIGTALSISALPVIARILMDLGLIRRSLGVVILSAATIDDLIGWSLFAVILSKFAEGAPTRSLWVTLALVVGLIASILTVGRWIGQRAFRWLKLRSTWPSGFLALTAVLVLLTAATAELIGIHSIFGAFLIGVALAQSSEKRHQAHEVVHQFVMSFFAPIYFVSIGLKANFIAHFDLPLVLIVLVVACVGKIVGVSFGAWIGRLSPREALAVGFGMNARGGMGMILASVALEHKVIDPRVFVALIVMALVTSLLSGPIMHRLLLVKGAATGLANAVPDELETSEASPAPR